MSRIGFKNITDIDSISNMAIYKPIVKLEIFNESQSGFLNALNSSSVNVKLDKIYPLVLNFLKCRNQWVQNTSCVCVCVFKILYERK